MCIFKRFPETPLVVSNPNPLQNFKAELDDKGKIVFSPKDPVAPSLASEFSVTELALINRDVKISPRRVSSDVVDVEKNLL